MTFRRRMGPLIMIGLLGGLPSLLHPQSTNEILSRALWETPARDLGSIFSAPVHDSRATLLGTGLLLGLVATDGWTTRQYQEHLAPLGEDLRSWLTLPSVVGDETLFAPIDGYAMASLAAVYAAGVFTQKVRLQEAGILSLKAVLKAYLVSHLVLKTALARNRPNYPIEGGELEAPYSRDPWDFFNWHRPYFGSNPAGTSFPSFHLTFYFAVARVMQLSFENTWVPYTLAAFPLLYEADNHRHWVSDMIAGALISTLIGNVVVRNYPAGRGQSAETTCQIVGGEQGQSDGWFERQLSRLTWSAAPLAGGVAEFPVEVAF